MALFLAYIALKKLGLLIIDHDGMKIGPEPLQRGTMQFTEQQPHGSVTADEGII